MREHYDFSKAVKNPYYGKFIKDGKFIVDIEKRDGTIETYEVDAKTLEQTKIGELVDKK